MKNKFILSLLCVSVLSLTDLVVTSDAHELRLRNARAIKDNIKAVFTQAKTGVDSAKAFASTLSSNTLKLKSSMLKFASSMSRLSTQLAPVLAGLGPLARVVAMFIPTTEEKLLQQLITEMKAEFKQVNERLDQVFSKLDNMAALIKDQTLKAMYERDKDRIVHATALIQHMMAAKTTNGTAGYAHQIKMQEGKKEIEFSADRIRRKLMDGSFSVIFKDVSNSNRQIVHERLMEHYNMVMNGVKFYLVWLQLKSEDIPAYTETFRALERDRWERNLKALLVTIADTDRRLFIDNWETNYPNEFNKLITGVSSLKTAADQTFEYLQGKYDWRAWFLIVYDPVSGWEKHTFEYCPSGAISHLRWNGMNVYLGHAPIERSFKKDYAMKLLESYSVTTYQKEKCWSKNPGGPGPTICEWFTHRYNDALVTFNSCLACRWMWKCTSTIFPNLSYYGVIRNSANVHHRALPDRQAVRNADGVVQIIMG